MSSETAWIVARAGGLVGYGLLTATVVLGILHSARTLRSVPRFAIEHVHRFLSLTMTVFIVLHGLGLLLDQVVPFTLSQLVVPFTSDVAPIPVGLGVIAAELMLAIAVTNALRDRIGYRLWRTLHALAFPAWALATVHGVLSGTDSDQWWAMALYATASALTVGLLAWRLRGARLDEDTVTSAALAGVTAALVAVTLAVAPLALERATSNDAGSGVTTPASSGAVAP